MSDAAEGIVVGRTELVTAAEIAQRFGVSAERVRVLRARDDFPKPAGTVNQTTPAPVHLWRWAQVRQWGERAGYLERAPR